MHYDFYYDVPTRITSNHAIAVHNRDGKVVFHLQKYHKSMLQKVLALQFTTWFINVSIKDMSEKELAKAEDFGFVKRNWALTGPEVSEKIILTDTSTWKMNERKMGFFVDGKEYLISKKTDDSKTMLYENGTPIVIMEESGKMPPRQNYIAFERETDLPTPAVICMLHLFEIGV